MNKTNVSISSPWHLCHNVALEIVAPSTSFMLLPESVAELHGKSCLAYPHRSNDTHDSQVHVHLPLVCEPPRNLLCRAINADKREEGIRLGQFMKFASILDSGGDVKEAIIDGYVEVNGEVDRRRGRQLQVGDVVTFEGRSFRVQA